MEDYLERGWWLYGEEKVLTQQNENIKPFLSELLLQEQPEVIIELGTSFGGLTVILSDIIKEVDLDTHLISYDDSIREWIPELAAKYNFDLIKKHIGEEATNNEIKGVIENTSGKVIVLCDGGGKPYEFNTFSKYLKPGDIIGAHDYADDRADFEARVKGKLWNWMEIEYAHIRENVENYNLIDLTNDLTEKGKQVAWIFKQKISSIL